VPCDKNNTADGNFTAGYPPEGAFMLESPKPGKNRDKEKWCSESTGESSRRYLGECLPNEA
jgi:hypothetical protein